MDLTRPCFEFLLSRGRGGNKEKEKAEARKGLINTRRILEQFSSHGDAVQALHKLSGKKYPAGFTLM